MPFDPNTKMQLRPVDQWFINAPNGDAVFADPFVTELELMASPDYQGFDPIALDPNMPPPIFDAHPRYQNGYDFFRNIGVLNSALEIGVLLTGSEIANDIGNPGMFEAMIAESDVVIVGFTRGVAAEAAGRLSLPKGVTYQKDYQDRIFEIAADHRKPIHILDAMVEETDEFEGAVHPPIDKLLKLMRDRVIDEGKRGMDPARYLKADRAYRNQMKWQIAGAIGDILFETQNEGELNDLATIILPADLLDVPRRLTALGMSYDNIGADFADNMLRTKESMNDSIIFQNGRIGAGEH